MKVQFLDQEDPLDKGMTTQSSILAWRIPWREEPGRIQSMGSHRVRHNWSNLAHTHAQTAITDVLGPRTCTYKDMHLDIDIHLSISQNLFEPKVHTFSLNWNWVYVKTCIPAHTQIFTHTMLFRVARPWRVMKSLYQHGKLWGFFFFFWLKYERTFDGRDSFWHELLSINWISLVWDVEVTAGKGEKTWDKKIKIHEKMIILFKLLTKLLSKEHLGCCWHLPLSSVSIPKHSS